VRSSSVNDEEEGEEVGKKRKFSFVRCITDGGRMKDSVEMNESNQSMKQ